MEWMLLGLPVGIVLLYLGSEWMVDGAKKMALRLGVTPFMVGLTVVAFGSSAPEAVTSLVSTANPQIIIGNVVGSNIANIGLAIGLAALISPIASRYGEIRFEIISAVFSVALLTLLALNGTIGPVEGAALVASLFVFVYLVYRLKKDRPKRAPEAACCSEPAEEVRKTSLMVCIVMVAVGILALYFGAKAFVEGAKVLASMMGVSDLMIGLIVVAVGTSLPELCICIMAAYRKENDIVVSNILGSVVFNCFFALGIGALLVDIPVTHYMMAFHMPVMVAFTVLLALMIRSGNSVRRWEGAVLLILYSGYIAAMAVWPQLTSGVL
ncbi:MAG: calcium/sodium antiporter [Candidatus Methanomethylophilaceae archaeon]|jgi:cation:H+ antiporter|nr:calcium/sodium antiporter [Candidatus Methanomethylophilaceae archaeon]